MDQILSQCPCIIRITDDVIVHRKDDEDYNKNLHHLMKVARKCGLVFNAEKCFIKTQQIKFFGMIYDVNVYTLTLTSVLKSRPYPPKRLSRKFISFCASTSSCPPSSPNLLIKQHL